MQALRFVMVVLVALVGLSGVADAKSKAKNDLGVPVSALLERMGAKDVGLTFQSTRTDQGQDSRWMGIGARKVLLLAGDSETSMATGLRMRIWLTDGYDGTDSILILDLGTALATVFPNWSGRSAWLMSGLMALEQKRRISTVQDGVKITLELNKKDGAITMTLLPKGKK